MECVPSLAPACEVLITFPNQPDKLKHAHIFPNILQEDSVPRSNPKGTKWIPTSKEVTEIPKMLKSSDVFRSVLACPQDLDLQLSEAVTVFDSAQGLVQSRCE